MQNKILDLMKADERINKNENVNFEDSSRGRE